MGWPVEKKRVGDENRVCRTLSYIRGGKQRSSSKEGRRPAKKEGIGRTSRPVYRGHDLLQNTNRLAAKKAGDTGRTRQLRGGRRKREERSLDRSLRHWGERGQNRGRVPSLERNGTLHAVLDLRHTPRKQKKSAPKKEGSTSIPRGRKATDRLIRRRLA